MILMASPPQDCITWLNTVQRDLRTHNLTLNRAVDLAHLSSMEAYVYVWHYALLEVHARKEEVIITMIVGDK